MIIHRDYAKLYKAMKTLKTPLKITILTGVAMAAGLALVAVFSPTEEAQANLCVSERCIEAQRAEAAASAEQLKAANEKNAYQAEVNRYAAEINVIQAQIIKDEEEIAELGVRIENTKKKIEHLRESLKDTLVKLHLTNDVSAIEVIASADSVADFTTKSANHSVVQGKVSQLATEAKEAKEQLEKQKTEVEQKKANNQAQQSLLASKQSEQQKFVNEWKGKEDSYAATANSFKKIREEEQEKQRQIVLSQQGGSGYSGDPNKGHYPYSGECPWNADTNAPIGGQLGYGLKCECYSYGIWKIYQYTGSLPTNLRYYNGPKEWYGLYGSKGGGTTPRENSAAISTGGAYGHVVWVEYINSDGTIHISQYNAKPWDYSEADVSPYTYSWYLYY